MKESLSFIEKFFEKSWLVQWVNVSLIYFINRCKYVAVLVILLLFLQACLEKYKIRRVWKCDKVSLSHVDLSTCSFSSIGLQKQKCCSSYLCKYFWEESLEKIEDRSEFMSDRVCYPSAGVLENISCWHCLFLWDAVQEQARPGNQERAEALE